jgi:DNA-binding response OmpR family regulator
MKILVIDDSITSLKLLEIALKNDGYSVETAKNGEEGLEKIRIFEPDLIFLDVEMPGMNGFELCRILKKNSKFALIKVVLLTAKTEEEDRDWGLDLGADEYVTKPFDYETVKKIIQKYFPESR